VPETGSANGVRFTETLARELGQSDLMIASGLARGIDAAAHRGALNSGTVGVMAGGVDIIYPRENDSLYGQILESGALISEQPFGTRPQARHFPTRNRIVSGIALGTVVIEATLRSGSLITARLAGEQGRDVMAVPGTPMDPRARGTNKLIREGAVLVESADDVLEAMIPILRRPMTEHDPSPYHSPEPAVEISETDMDEAREQIINALGPAPSTMDDIVRTSGVSSQFSAMVFLELELAGRLDRHPGGQVSLAFI
jgi:DNA processing protein